MLMHTNLQLYTAICNIPGQGTTQSSITLVMHDE